VEHFRDLAETRKLRPLIDRVMDFDDLLDATRYLETGQKLGNLVMTV
jgi:NADPH:quinone reductase-like Zn-dependent oxidoreductase